eukprot:scaffold8864_cov122-Isochrysis_galbana.AAC.2
MPQLPQPVLRAQSLLLARSTAQSDAISPSAEASARHQTGPQAQAQSHRPGVSGDCCAGWKLARVAERRLWPFQLPSSLPCREQKKTVCGAAARREHLDF